MHHRVLIEFVVDVPSAGVAKDVQTRLVKEHHTRLCEALASVMGYVPLQAPDKPGVFVAYEPVLWNDTKKDWVGDDDIDDAE